MDFFLDLTTFEKSSECLLSLVSRTEYESSAILLDNGGEVFKFQCDVCKTCLCSLVRKIFNSNYSTKDVHFVEMFL